MGNRIRTTVLLAILTAVILWIGQAFGGRQGMVIALLFAGGMNVFSYWFSDKMVLRMYRAREADAAQNPELYGIIRSLTASAGLPMPRIFIIPESSPNAFATGRNPSHAAVAVTEGLLERMNPEELKGVLAHELSHVRNHDILIGSIAATLAGAVMVLASMARWSAIFGGLGGNDEDSGGLGVVGLIVMSIMAPVAATLIQMAISRSREYLADETGARIAGTPEGLAHALEKLGTETRRIPMNAQPATAHMFIVNPLSGARLANLFSTHPPLEDRIARLRGTRPPEPRPDADGPRNPSTQSGEDFWNQLRG